MNTNQSDARINNQADSRYSTNQTEQRHNSSTWDKYGFNNITRVTLDFVTILVRNGVDLIYFYSYLTILWLDLELAWIVIILDQHIYCVKVHLLHTLLPYYIQDTGRPTQEICSYLAKITTTQTEVTMRMKRDSWIR